MTIRRAILPKDDPYDTLIKRIAALTKERRVLVVEVRRIAENLKQQVAEAGGDMEALHILDATGARELVGADDGITTVPGPHMLEMIALRAKQLVVHRAKRRTIVIIDDVLSFSRIADDAALIETVHQAIAIHDDVNIQEFVIHPDVPLELQARLADVIPDEVVIGADGLELPTG